MEREESVWGSKMEEGQSSPDLGKDIDISIPPVVTPRLSETSGVSQLGMARGMVAGNGHSRHGSGVVYEKTIQDVPRIQTTG